MLIGVHVCCVEIITKQYQSFIIGLFFFVEGARLTRLLILGEYLYEQF